MTLGRNVLIANGILAFSIIVMNGIFAEDESRSNIRVRTKRADDKVAIDSQEDKTAILIRSPYGISQAVIERADGVWPSCLVLKLQLKGLEHFRLTNGVTTVQGAMSAQNEKLSVRLWKDRAEEAPLGPSSPYWIKARMLDSNGKPSNAIPLQDGVFELVLPKAIFENNPQKITVSWIDFYRG